MSTSSTRWPTAQQRPPSLRPRKSGLLLSMAMSQPSTGSTPTSSSHHSSALQSHRAVLLYLVCGFVAGMVATHHSGAISVRDLTTHMRIQQPPVSNYDAVNEKSGSNPKNSVAMPVEPARDETQFSDPPTLSETPTSLATGGNSVLPVDPAPIYVPQPQSIAADDMYLDGEVARRIMFSDIVDDLPNPKGRPTMVTSYQKSTVVRQASWFQSDTICHETCCAKSYAVSLDADDHHLITTVDGLDLADVVLHGHNKQNFLEWGQSDLSSDILPCLQPGVIVYGDHEGGGVARFYDMYRPNMTVPYVLITGETDGNEPMGPYNKNLETDELLLRWYGINPRYASGANNKKFRMMHLGLARNFDQQNDLLALQTARNFQNPFVGSAKTRWTQSTALKDAVDTSSILFVKFGLRKRARIDAFGMACTNRTTPALDDLSCNQNISTSRETYTAASKYLFGLSPPGNGKDCFRTYELLFLGIIPIVQAQPEYDELFKGLPVIQLSGWNYTQLELVKVLQEYISSREFLDNQFEGMDRLYLAYHRQRVLKDAKRHTEIIEDNKGNKYYKKWAYNMYKPRYIGSFWPPKEEKWQPSDF